MRTPVMDLGPAHWSYGYAYMIYAAWPPGPTGANISDPHLVGDLKPSKWHTRWCETRSHRMARARGENGQGLLT